MAINFGGLATGLDTSALITELMKAERAPIDRLEREKNYQTSRLAAFEKFDEKLESLLGKFKDLDTSSEVRSFKATAGSEEFFSATGSSTAAPGTYQVEVKNLAQLQKDVSQGFASKTAAEFGTGSITLSVDGTDTVVNYSDASLTDIMNSINDADAGVSASIINDGVTGYRLVLSGDDSATTFSAVTNETVAGTYAPPAFTNKQSALQAAIVVDGIDIQSKNNTFSEAIPGVTLDLNKVNAAGETTVLTLGVDETTTKTKVEALVSSYNDVVSYIAAQKDADWGRDSNFRMIKGRLQGLLVTSVAGSGKISTLSQLGITTERDGTLKLDTAKLTDAIENDLDSVDKLFAGESGVEGLAEKFSSYLSGITDSTKGFVYSQKASTDASVRRIDRNIANSERRLESREANLRSQFDALEELVSAMNSQSAFLTQQMSMLSNLGSK